MADLAPPNLAPVRGAVAPLRVPLDAAAAPARRRLRDRRPPAPSLAVLAVGSLLVIGGWAYLGLTMIPRPHGGLLRAPIARTLDGACVTNPVLCPSRVPSP